MSVKYDVRHQHRSRQLRNEYRRCCRCWIRESAEAHHLLRFNWSPLLPLCEQCHDVAHWWARRIEDLFGLVFGLVGARKLGRQIGKKFMWLATLWSIAYRTVIQAAVVALAAGWLVTHLIEGKP